MRKGRKLEICDTVKRSIFNEIVSGKNLKQLKKIFDEDLAERYFEYFNERIKILKTWYESAIINEQQNIETMSEDEWIKHAAIMHDKNLLDFYKMMFRDDKNFTLLNNFIKNLKNDDDGYKKMEKLLFI